MNNQEYEQKKRECWEEYLAFNDEEYSKSAFSYAFDRAYALGKHNLTSDAEGEVMLTVPRSKVQKIYKEATDIIHKNSKKEGVLFFQMVGMSSLLLSFFWLQVPA